MASIITGIKMVIILVLLLCPSWSPAFFVLYALAGVTDMLDGHVARKMGTQSEFGSRLDSIADLVLVVVCFMKILPAIAVPAWLWIWARAMTLV